MKSIFLAAGIAVSTLSMASVGSAQSLSGTIGSTSGVPVEARVPHSSGGSIVQRSGRYVKGTFQRAATSPASQYVKGTFQRAAPSPASQQVAKQGLYYGLRGGGALLAGKAAPVILAAGTAYGLYEAGKYGWNYLTTE